MVFLMSLCCTLSMLASTFLVASHIKFAGLLRRVDGHVWTNLLVAHMAAANAAMELFLLFHKQQPKLSKTTIVYVSGGEEGVGRMFQNLDGGMMHSQDANHGGSYEKNELVQGDGQEGMRVMSSSPGSGMGGDSAVALVSPSPLCATGSIFLHYFTTAYVLFNCILAWNAYEQAYSRRRSGSSLLGHSTMWPWFLRGSGRIVLGWVAPILFVGMFSLLSRSFGRAVLFPNFSSSPDVFGEKTEMLIPHTCDTTTVIWVQRSTGSGENSSEMDSNTSSWSVFHTSEGDGATSRSMVSPSWRLETFFFLPSLLAVSFTLFVAVRSKMGLSGLRWSSMSISRKHARGKHQEQSGCCPNRSDESNDAADISEKSRGVGSNSMPQHGQEGNRNHDRAAQLLSFDVARHDFCPLSFPEDSGESISQRGTVVRPEASAPPPSSSGPCPLENDIVSPPLHGTQDTCGKVQDRTPLHAFSVWTPVCKEGTGSVERKDLSAREVRPFGAMQPLSEKISLQPEEEQEKENVAPSNEIFQPPKPRYRRMPPLPYRASNSILNIPWRLNFVLGEAFFSEAPVSSSAGSLNPNGHREVQRPESHVCPDGAERGQWEGIHNKQSDFFHSSSFGPFSSVMSDPSLLHPLAFAFCWILGGTLVVLSSHSSFSPSSSSSWEDTNMDGIPAKMVSFSSSHFRHVSNLGMACTGLVHGYLFARMNPNVWCRWKSLLTTTTMRARSKLGRRGMVLDGNGGGAYQDIP